MKMAYKNENAQSSPDQPTYRIKSVSISIEISRKCYGEGDSVYAYVAAYCDNSDLADTVDHGICLMTGAWKTLIAGSLVTELAKPGGGLRATITRIDERLEKVRNILRENPSSPSDVTKP
jgi:hypothetical protein